VRPVRLKVTRPIRAGPVKEPALCSIYMIRVLRPGGLPRGLGLTDRWTAAITAARAAAVLVGRLGMADSQLRQKWFGGWSGTKDVAATTPPASQTIRRFLKRGCIGTTLPAPCGFGKREDGG
jgi:hypothetical protein